MLVACRPGVKSFFDGATEEPGYPFKTSEGDDVDNAINLSAS
jgi:hypothetical protein